MPDAKANILVAFYSRDGSVEALAKAIGEGARQAGAEVRLRRVPDIVAPAVMASRTARRKRDDDSDTVHPDGAPGVHHCANRLHSREDCSGSWDAVRSVSNFRTKQRPTDG